jgi:hypothetical protein
MSWPLGLAPNGWRRRTASASRPAIRMASRLGSIRSASRRDEGMAVNACRTPSVAARRSTVSSSTRFARCEATVSPAAARSAAARSKASARRVVGRTPKTGVPVRASVSSHCRPTRRLGAISQRPSPRCWLRTAGELGSLQRHEPQSPRLPAEPVPQSPASRLSSCCPPSAIMHQSISQGPGFGQPSTYQALLRSRPGHTGCRHHWLHSCRHRAFCQPTTDRSPNAESQRSGQRVSVKSTRTSFMIRPDTFQSCT